MNLSVHHVAVIVSDYAAANHFYVDLLGLPVVRENCRGNGLWKLDLRLGDGELEIFNWLSSAPLMPLCVGAAANAVCTSQPTKNISHPHFCCCRSSISQIIFFV